jgi:hypothetical protein
MIFDNRFLRDVAELGLVTVHDVDDEARSASEVEELGYQVKMRRFIPV